MLDGSSEEAKSILADAIGIEDSAEYADALCDQARSVKA